MMKLYKITDCFMDGDGEMKHAQSGRILEGRFKRETGITWWWRQTSKGQQYSGFAFDGTDYTDWEAVKAAYLAKTADPAVTKEWGE